MLSQLYEFLVFDFHVRKIRDSVSENMESVSVEENEADVNK